MDLDLKGSVALATVGNRGIGLATAHAPAAAACRMPHGRGHSRGGRFGRGTQR